jgi:hypothetical protein
MNARFISELKCVHAAQAKCDSKQALSAARKALNVERDADEKSEGAGNNRPRPRKHIHQDMFTGPGIFEIGHESSAKDSGAFKSLRRAVAKK